MEFLKRLDLRFISKSFEWIALFILVVGIILSLLSLISKFRLAQMTGYTPIFFGFFRNLIHYAIMALGTLFISRVGYAIDDIKNSLLNRENNQVDKATQGVQDVESEL